MKNYFTNILIRVLTIFLGALICHLCYSFFNLSEIFNSNISYLQWLGITVIITVITPTSIKSIKNDAKGIKIS